MNLFKKALGKFDAALAAEISAKTEWESKTFQRAGEIARRFVDGKLQEAEQMIATANAITQATADELVRRLYAMQDRAEAAEAKLRALAERD